MEKTKVKLKTERKDLIRAGKNSEADKKLREIWKIAGIVKGTNAKKPSKKYTKESLEALSFTDLKKVGAEFGTTDRSKKNLIKEILELQ